MPAFPETFAILGNQRAHEPFWQILRSTVSSNGIEVESDKTYRSAETFLETNSSPFILHEGIFRLSTGDTMSMKFWFLPIQLQKSFGRVIPVMDFEYKSWLPRPSYRIPLTHLNEVKQLHRTAYHLFQNRTISQTSPSGFTSLAIRPPTPPRQRPASETDSESIGSTESVLTVLLEQQDASSIQQKPLHLPDHVGQLLLKQAYLSDECCSISGISFKELDSLSVTSCFHIFDAVCLEQWQLRKNDCPVCRCPITNVVTVKKN